MKKEHVAPNITFSINPEIVYGIINSAHEIQAKEGVTFPDELSDTDFLQILADHKGDLTFQEIKSVIEELEPDQQVDLLTLMYVGRGDFDIEDWSSARKEAKNNLVPRLAEYLFSKPQIAEYLAKGLELLGYTDEE